MFRNFWYALGFRQEFDRGRKSFEFLGHDIEIEKLGASDFVAIPSPDLGALIVSEVLPSWNGFLPATVQYGIIWFFAGLDPANAILNIPELPEFSDSKWKFVQGRYSWPVEMTRAVENLLDLSHPFLTHKNTFGNSNFPVPQLIEFERNTWSVSDSIKAAPPGNLFALLQPRQDYVGRLQVTLWMPNVTRLDIRLDGQDVVLFMVHIPVRAGRVDSIYLHLRTISTAAIVDGLLKKLFEAVLNEDRRVVITQDKMPTDLKSEVHFKFDRAQLYYRRMLERAIGQQLQFDQQSLLVAGITEQAVPEPMPQGWYPCVPSEKVNQKPVQVTFHPEDGAPTNVVLYRTSAGTVVGFPDRCPHRRVALSAGTVTDGCLQCPFHGLVFNSSGECVQFPPLGETVPKLKLQVLAIFESYGIVWVSSAATQGQSINTSCPAIAGSQKSKLVARVQRMTESADVIVERIDSHIAERNSCIKSDSEPARLVQISSQFFGTLCLAIAVRSSGEGKCEVIATLTRTKYKSKVFDIAARVILSRLVESLVS